MAKEEPHNPWLMGKLWDNIKAVLAAWVDIIWGEPLRFWPKLLKQTTNEVTGFLSSVEEERWKALFQYAVDAKVLPQKQADKLMELKDLAHPFDWVMYLSFLTRFITTAIDAPTEAGMNFLRQSVNKDLRPNLPDYRDILGAAFVAPEKTEPVCELMRKQGYTDEDIDLLFISVYRLYDENMIRTLYLRGVLSEDTMIIRMKELGYTETRIREIKESWQLIPGPQDLFMMVAKEAFEPEFIEKIGLDDEFPEEQVEWLEKQGVSEFWAKKYWYAHWDQPSVQMGFEMLHRGIIDYDELDLLFRAIEMPPFWRDKLTKIAFNPYTRVDTRRMHDMGVLSDSELIQAYKDQGYDETRAGKMAEFTKKYNAQGQKELTKGQIISTYMDNLLSRQDALALLIKLEYPEPYAEFLLSYEEFKRDKKLAEQRVKNAGDRFKLNSASAFETRLKLAALNVSGERIDVLMETWDIDRIVDSKFPSKTDLDKFFLNKIITAEQYADEMEKLGYKEEYRIWYMYLLGKKK